MKKICCSILLLVFVFSLSLAQGEESTFTLRNGIKYGDSIEEVKSKETLALSLQEKQEDDESDDVRLFSDHATIANVDDSYLCYTFNTLGLYSLKYNFRNNLKGDLDAMLLVRAFDFDDIDDGLTVKYGEPIDEENPYANVDSSTQTAFDALVAMEQYLSKGKSSNLAKKGTERVIVLSDGIVKIEHYIYVYTDELTMHQLSYTFYTNEQVEQINGNRNPGNKVTDDL